MERRICHFTGRVQGVGFRYTTQNIAMRYDVGGFVRNLPDGRVELVVEGPENEVDNLLQILRERMNGYIKAMDMNTAPPTGEFTRFGIRH